MGDMADLIIYGDDGETNLRMCEICGEIHNEQGLKCPACENAEPNY